VPVRCLLRAAISGSAPGEDLPVKSGYELEQQYTLRLARTDDAREALTAPREKRDPQFTGR
jgi:hypothetical protein